MNREKRQENKKEDKKALKQFGLIMLLSLVSGVVFGVISIIVRAIGEDNVNIESVREIGKVIGKYGLYVVTAIAWLVIGILHHQGRKLFSNWDGEDETTITVIETKLSYALWFDSLALISAYLLFSIGSYLIIFTNKVGEGTIDMIDVLILMVGFIFSIAFNSIAQQKIVNFEKEINPEKKGSVFDTKFQDKWMQGCDEAERFIIYKSAYKAYRVMNIAFAVAWLICMLAIVAFGFDITASVVVTILWAVMTSAYSLQSIYYSKHPSEVMK